MQKVNNLQDIFLTKARKESVPVTLFLVNGFQLRGIITGFDCFVVVLDSEGRQQVIYKHAISTIAPARARPTLPCVLQRLAPTESPYPVWRHLSLSISSIRPPRTVWAILLSPD